MPDRISILCVEDDADHANLIFRHLQRIVGSVGIRLLRDGQEAVDYLFGQGKYEQAPVQEKPDVIVLDLRLPKLDGLEVLRRLREDDSLRKVKVVVLTSSDRESDIEEARKYQADGYLIKPEGFRGLAKMVEEMLLVEPQKVQPSFLDLSES